MSTDIRPELSKRSKYWIPRHRYYELKHFVMQYPEWSEAIKYIDSMVRACEDRNGKLNNIPDPVGKAVENRWKLVHNISICDNAARETDTFIGKYILEAIINGLSYEQVSARHTIPYCKDSYYDLYHKFFWLLDAARK